MSAPERRRRSRAPRAHPRGPAARAGGGGAGPARGGRAPPPPPPPPPPPAPPAPPPAPAAAPAPAARIQPEPVRAAATPLEPAIVSEVVPQRAETVLLVEDALRVRAVVREILEMNGYNVLEARHGVEALEISERHQGPNHLMVTDVVMPQMSGRELAQRLASAPGHK